MWRVSSPLYFPFSLDISMILKLAVFSNELHLSFRLPIVPSFHRLSFRLSIVFSVVDCLFGYRLSFRLPSGQVASPNKEIIKTPLLLLLYFIRDHFRIPFHLAVPFFHLANSFCFHM